MHTHTTLIRKKKKKADGKMYMHKKKYVKQVYGIDTLVMIAFYVLMFVGLVKVST